MAYERIEGEGCSSYGRALDGDGLDAVALNVYAVDSAGIFVPTANNYIQFSISGSAYILGVGNGDPNCHEPDQAEGRSLFNGCCQAIISRICNVSHDIRADRSRSCDKSPSFISIK